MDNSPGSSRQFYSPTKGTLSFVEVVRDIAAFIEEDPDRRYKLIVGTDSEARAGKDVGFVSVIVVHRVGRAGRYFWTRTKTEKMPSLRQRIYHEAVLSLALAEELTHGVGISLNGYLVNGKCELEIHVDIGQFGPTREMIREIVGMVTANGFQCRIKPEAYAASTVADKHV